MEMTSTALEDNLFDLVEAGEVEEAGRRGGRLGRRLVLARVGPFAVHSRMLARGRRRAVDAPRGATIAAAGSAIA